MTQRATPGNRVRWRACGILALMTLCALLLIPGCNLFSSLHTPGDSDNVDDLVSDARAALEKQEYNRAMSIMEKAIGIAPDDPRVRYLHAVSAVKYNGIDLLDIVEIFQPEDAGSVVNQTTQQVLFLTSAELERLFAAFNVVRADLEPLVGHIVNEGRELPSISESDDVLLSHGIAETLIGMLRVLDNDDTPAEFSLDDRIVIDKTATGYEIRIDDSLLNATERDLIIDTALNNSWQHFVDGRASFFLYYQFVVEERIWSSPVASVPEPFPAPIDTSTVIGEMAGFVDDGVKALYDEKEDLQGMP